MCDHKGLGLSQEARFGEQCSDPDQNTARQVLEALPDWAQICVDSYASTLLDKYYVDVNALLAKY